MLKAEATDADDPETDNAALRYSILGPEGAGLFAINELSGEIHVARDGLDREVWTPPLCPEAASGHKEGMSWHEMGRKREERGRGPNYNPCATFLTSRISTTAESFRIFIIKCSLIILQNQIICPASLLYF